MARERNRRILYASGVGIAQRIVQVVTSLVMLPVVIHSLGVRDFGVWGAATSLAWLSGMLDLGIGSSLLTLLPQVEVSGKADQARRYVAAALFGGCALALLVALVGASVVLIGTTRAQVAPLLVAVAGLAINVPLSLTGNVWLGLQKGHVAGGWELVQTVSTFASLMIGASLHAGVIAMVAAVYVPMIASGTASLIHVLVVHSELRPHALVPGSGPLRLVIGQGGMLFGITMAFSACYAFDNLLALQLLGPAASAQTAVALRICTLVAGLFAVVTQPLWPAFVDAVARGDSTWAMRTLARGTAATVVLAVVAAVLVLSCGNDALRWWLGPGMELPPMLLSAVAAWIVVLCVPRVANLMFNAASILRPQLIVAMLALALTAVLKASLSGRFGVPGLVAAAPIGWLVVVWPAFLWLAFQVRSGRLTSPTETA